MESRTVFVEFRVSDLLIKEARAEALIEEEKSVTQLLKEDIKLVGSTLRVYLGEDFSAQKANGVYILKVLVLLSNAVDILLFLIGKGTSIFVLLLFAFLCQLGFLLLEFTLAMIKESEECHRIEEVSSEDEPESLFVPLENKQANQGEGKTKEDQTDHEDNCSGFKG